MYFQSKRFGRSLSVWLALLSLLLLISLIWMRQSMLSSYSSMVGQVDSYYQGITTGTTGPGADAGAIRTIMDGMAASNTRTMVMTIVMFAFALIIMMTNHSYMNRRSKESEDAANRDPMTGVFSKHAYLDKEKEIDAELSEGVLRDFSIVVCDVNGLKKINDTYGHKAGDDYIRKASTMLCSIFSHSQMYRVGGDEFVALLTGRDHTVRQELMAELHDRSVANISTAGAQAVVSGGISDYIPGTDHSVHEIFERADAAMYEEKMRLKSLGAVTRDEEPEPEVPDTPEIENIPMINVRRHVLIAEDELVNREMLGNLLQDEYEILYAGDGIETLESIREHKDELALLLLDLNMPGMTGLEILTAMKADSAISSIPVIVMTADQQAELECLKLGAIDFIPKPYPICEIVKARVAKCIELAETRDLIQHTQRDNLTGLFNPDYFLRYVDRYDQQYWDVAMDAVVIDVNRFHLINELYGRQYGDIILCRVGENVRKLARRIGGIGCRRGADTFLIYCPHRDDYAQLLEKLYADIVKEEASASRVHLRLGVYPEADKEIAAERRFDRAKIAADSRKDENSQSIGIYSEEMGKEALYREKLVEDFRISVTNNQFKIYLQPKYDIHGSTPVVMGAEALVRWDHPELGLINPSMFIPVLEENGLILDLDRFVWTETAAQIRKWKDKGGHSVPVSFNVSRVDMLNPNLRNIFHEILETYRLTTDDIILEITESAYTGDSEQIIATARELHSMGMGFRIEIDDFGTGYSSLSMLRELPIDALKLDMALAKPALDKDGDERMIRLIIDIAQYLQVPVVAEGVETQAQYEILRELGCGFAQGYYFSKPIPKEDFDYYLT